MTAPGRPDAGLWEPYAYYVTFVNEGRSGRLGYGSMLLRTDVHPDCLDVVRGFRVAIEAETGFPADSIVILWWQRMSGDEPQTSTTAP